MVVLVMVVALVVVVVVVVISVIMVGVTISAVSETRRMAGLLYQGTIPDLGQKRDSVRMTKDE